MMRGFSLNDLLRRASAPAAVVASVLAIGGCGSAPAGEVPTTTAAPPPVVGVVLAVTGTEYSFGPTTLKAAAGPTTIRFSNRGAMEHDFVIDALNLNVVAKPGKSADVSVSLTPGTYQTYCSVPGHRQSGMQGTLTVS